MNRLQAILISLLLVVFVQYARAGVATAAGAGCAGEREAIGSGYPAIAGADSDSIGGYQSEDPAGTGEAPESVGPGDEMNPAGSQPGNEDNENIGGEQPPTETGNLPESVEPSENTGTGGAPSDSTPGY